MPVSRLSKLHISVVCLVGTLILANGPNLHAETFSNQNWEIWNAAAPSHYPGESWHRYAVPEDAGWSSEGLSSARKMSEAAGSAAVMVIYNGAILTQWGRTERRFMCHSIRKSLLSALIGIAVSKGEIDIEATIESIGIDDISGLTETERSAKVSDLLKSRSGIYLPAAYETPSNVAKRPERGSHQPGSFFYYNNWDFNVLATIYNRKTDGDVFEAFRRELATPLQMQDFAIRHTYYHLEPEKSRHPAYPFRMSARDLARFGLLYLNEGMWKEAQIIPSEWVRESTKPFSTTVRGGYGYMWWTETGSLLGALGTYMARGFGGHVVYVVPGARLVFVHRVDTYNEKRIDGWTIRRILIKILKARTGPPRSSARLVPITTAPAVSIGANLTKANIAAVTGEYRGDSFTATVREIGGHIEVSSSLRGRYILTPRSPTEFMVEDAELRLSFEVDVTGRATAMKIWFASDDLLELPRVK